jgi:kynurenine formamidase
LGFKFQVVFNLGRAVVTTVTVTPKLQKQKNKHQKPGALLVLVTNWEAHWQTADMMDHDAPSESPLRQALIQVLLRHAGSWISLAGCSHHDDAS